MPVTCPRSWLRATYRTITAVSFAAFFIAVGLHQYYGTSLPTTPDPLAGRVYALAHHSTYVYMTRTEQLVLLVFFGAAILGILVAVVLRVANEGVHYKKRPGP